MTKLSVASTDSQFYELEALLKEQRNIIFSLFPDKAKELSEQLDDSLTLTKENGNVVATLTNMNESSEVCSNLYRLQEIIMRLLFTKEIKF